VRDPTKNGDFCIADRAAAMVKLPLSHQNDRISPSPAGACAAQQVDGELRDDEGGIAGLEDPSGIGEIRAVAFPQHCGDVRDLLRGACLLVSAAGGKHGSVLEQLGDRGAVADYERVLEQRLELLRGGGSASHTEANISPSGIPVCSHKGGIPPRSGLWRESTEAVATAVPRCMSPCWFTFDPASLLVTSHYQAEVLQIPPEWLAHEYFEDDFHKMAGVACSERGASTLHEADGWRPES
jgi:hypothetical protein